MLRNLPYLPLTCVEPQLEMATKLKRILLFRGPRPLKPLKSTSSTFQVCLLVPENLQKATKSYKMLPSWTLDTAVHLDSFGLLTLCRHFWIPNLHRIGINRRCPSTIQKRRHLECETIKF